MASAASSNTPHRIQNLSKVAQSYPRRLLTRITDESEQAKHLLDRQDLDEDEILYENEVKIGKENNIEINEVMNVSGEECNSTDIFTDASDIASNEGHPSESKR